jgi:hypothetical protein
MTAGWIRVAGQVTAVAMCSDVTSKGAPDDLPHERTLALLVVPGMKVIRDPEGLEAGLLGQSGLFDELAGRALLAGEK